MYWKQENKLRVVCTKKQREFHHIFTDIVRNITEVVQEFDFI